MFRVNCDLDCNYSEDGECQLEEISINSFGCNDYEKTKEPERPDKFYAFIKDIDINKLIWVSRMGIKEEFCGREIFVLWPNDDCFTDGKTGVLGSKTKLLKMSESELIKVFNDIEEFNGLSPLYTKDLKWPIREVSQ